MALYDKPLFIFEMANNHQGSEEHGKRIIRELAKCCQRFRPQFDFAVKFQYRDLDTFIHPSYRGRMDIKNIKRFSETRLEGDEQGRLAEAARQEGFYTVCTPFDEPSVDRIMEHGYDVIKIASCSFLDWPLLEKVAAQGKPVIASAAGSSLEDIGRVLSFFGHRGIDVSLMHCVAEYPTEPERLQMNQIDLFRKTFPGVRIGFSTHESPNQPFPILLAVAKGAEIFEKHVGLPAEGISLNGYSASPGQVEQWLENAQEAYRMCGVSGIRYPSSEKERADLAALQRGVFLRNGANAGDVVHARNSYCAFPAMPGQLLASDMSKYNHIVLLAEKGADQPIMRQDVRVENDRDMVEAALHKVLGILKESQVRIPNESKCCISHHYGIEHFEETGVAMIDCVNREYCKKVLVVLPGQRHPTHFHKRKEETFSIVHGELHVTLGDKEMSVGPGEQVVVERGVPHSFSSDMGCVFEEISTTHYKDDSYYEQEAEFASPRKTVVYITKDMLG